MHEITVTMLVVKIKYDLSVKKTDTFIISIFIVCFTFIIHNAKCLNLYRILHGSMIPSHESFLISLREARAAKSSLSKILDDRKLTEEIW